MDTAFEDLYDMERRPGAGVELWTNAVEHQLARVIETNYRHRLANSPNETEKVEDQDAEWQLHVEVYFLASAIRRVILFHDVLAKRVPDRRLADARAVFDRAAPDAVTFRNFFEHLDEYLLDSPRKFVKSVNGRTSPVLQCRWDSDNVVVAFGPLTMDITIAATAAIELGGKTVEVWRESLDIARSADPHPDPPAEDDGVPRMMQVTFGVSTTIGGKGEGPAMHTGQLIDVVVREATPQEILENQLRDEDRDGQLRPGFGPGGATRD